MLNKAKRESPLVRSVLALDDFLSELERIGTKINSTDMSTDFDLDYVQQLMTRFTECGQGITLEVSNLSKQLQEAQARAEAVAQGVGRQAELFNTRRNEHIEKMDEFRALGEKVRDLNAAIGRLRDDRANMASNLPALEAQLAALIADLEALEKSARASKIRALEKNAHSLIQTLQNVEKKLQGLKS